MEPIQSFHDAAHHAAHVVESLPRGSRWFLHCDTDADGLCAAAVVAITLRRAGHKFQVRASREKDAQTYQDLAKVECDGYFVLDKGTSHVDVLGEVSRATGRPVIVIDHHNILHKEVPKGVHLLNPRVVGMDGSHDASSSTSAVAFARAIDGRNMDMGPIGLVGAIGDWQHEGGWAGWNQDIVQDGLEHHHLEKRPQIAFIGMDLADAITRWEHPKVPGLFGDREATLKLLASIGIPAGVDNESLTPQQETKLLSALTMHGAANGMTGAELDRMVRPELTSTSLDTGLRRLFRIVDACGREGSTATGLALLMGDKGAWREALELFARYRDAIAGDLRRLGTEGPTARSSLQQFSIERDAYTGMVAGIGMTHVVTDTARPLIVSAPRGDGMLQVSTRGTKSHVEAGLDLGDACRQAAADSGGSGGGHPIAAGAVIPPERLDEFVTALDGYLKSQAFLETA